MEIATLKFFPCFQLLVLQRYWVQDCAGGLGAETESAWSSTEWSSQVLRHQQVFGPFKLRLTIQAELLLGCQEVIFKNIYAKESPGVPMKKIYFKRWKKKKTDFRKSQKLGLIQLLSSVFNKILRDSWALSTVIFRVSIRVCLSSILNDLLYFGGSVKTNMCFLLRISLEMLRTQRALPWGLEKVPGKECCSNSIQHRMIGCRSRLKTRLLLCW